MKLKFLRKRREEENVKTFVFEPEKNLEWIAGQYLIYNLEHKNKDNRGKMRFFTISAPPFEKNPSITTRIFNKNRSSFKTALLNLKKGDFIEAKGPDGDFILKDLKKEYVFIAGGIGITPFHSILKQLDFERKKVKIIVLNSNHTSDFIFKKELDDFTKNNKNLKIIYFVSPERIDKNEILKVPKDAIFYVSGPDPMVEEIEKILEEIKIPKKNIRSDYFSGYKS